MAGARVRDGGFDAIGLYGYKTASALARSLPGPITAASASMLGVVFAQGMRGRRAMVERHLRRARPDISSLGLRRLVQASFDSYAQYWVESFRLPSLSKAEVDAKFSYEGMEHLYDAREDGKGCIIALPHLGGWEWAGRWIADRGVPTTVVVEPLEPPELFEWFVSFRRELGMNVIALGPHAGSEVLKALRANHVVCLLSDRDIQGGGIEVEFFGERTTLPAGPATLALRTGAPILPVAVYNRPGGMHHGHVRPPLDLTRQGGLREDVARITQVLATELEALIRKAPEQWHLFQPNWPSDPGYGS